MPRLRLLLAGIAASLALFAAPAAAAPGDLDATFGSGGSVRLLPSEENIALRAVAVQPDLKIVLAGSDSTTNSVLVVRLLANGAMDPSFGSGGQVTTSFPGSFGEARAVALQPDGKIVVAGAVNGDGNSDFLVARYNSDGSPDGGFGGGDGIQAIPIAAGKEERAEAVAIGASGRILVTGEISLGGGNRLAGVAVLKAEGEPDTTFSGDGVTAIDTTTPDDDEGVAIAELPGGRILVGDETGVGGGDGFTLVQFLATGSPDPGFGGGDGFVKTPIPGGGSAGGRLTDFVVRPDGRIVASGYGYDENLPANEDSKFAAVGYLANGDLDSSFGTGGTFTQAAGVESDARAIDETPNGRFVLAGHYDNEAGDNSVSLLRLDSAGVTDTSYGSGGKVLRGVSAPFGDNFEDAALDAEERTVVVSRAYTGGGNTEVVVARYLGDKAPVLPISAPINRPAHAKMKAVPRKVAPWDLKDFRGTASDPDGNGVEKVQVAVVKQIRGGPRKVRDARVPPGIRCWAMKNATGKLKRVKAKAGRCPQRWLTVKGKAKWRFKLKGALPPGRYVVFARAVDGTGLAESRFSRKLRNRYAFRVLPPRR
ncbi:MAG TPA: delta-60 repeat domain-containing protein [Solirubrobacterales bacterium]|nr:delta-60 repeat domain-containing protein [Solirubrobacterales bacterium]